MKIILIIIMLLFSTSCKDIGKIDNNKSILSLSEYKDIKEEDIEKITMIFYGEGGDTDPVVYSTKDEIESMYNNFKNTNYGAETTSSCVDNTTVYTIYLKDGSTKKITFECSILVLKDKRYTINK